MAQHIGASCTQAQKDGVSLEAQETSCRNLCFERGYDVLSVHHEIRSASEDDLNQSKLTILAIINKLVHEDEPKILVVYSVSRFYRQVISGMHKAAMIKSAGKSLVSCTEMMDLYSSAGEFAFTQLLSAAQFESRLISDRVKSSLKQRKLQGWQLGKAPYGKRATMDNGIREFSDNQYEKDVKALIKLLRTAGTTQKKATEIVRKVSDERQASIEFSRSNHLLHPLDYSQIASLLNEFGVQKRGKQWNASSVRQVAIH